jgi:hypothetical protein
LAFIIATRSRGGWLSLVAAIVVVGLLAGLQKSDIRMPVGLRRFKALILVVGAAGVVLISAVPANIGKGAGEAMWHGKSSVGQAVSSISVRGLLRPCGTESPLSGKLFLRYRSVAGTKAGLFSGILRWR